VFPRRTTPRSLSRLAVWSLTLWAITCGLLWICQPAHAQQQAPVTVLAGLDRTQATVGDPVGLTVTIRYPSTATLDAGDLGTQMAPFEVLSADPPADQRAADGTNERRFRFKIAAYQTGQLRLPPLTVSYTLEGQTGQAQSPPLSFSVESVIPAGEKPADIRPLKPQLDLPLSVAPPLRRIAAGAAAVVALVLLTLIAWILLRRRAPAPIAAPEELPPLEAEARAELDAIVEEGLLSRGDYRTHYARIAECIRRYLSHRYGFPASALTTTELSERMVRTGVGRWRARLVADLLAECDAVHYAHYLPAPARADADLQMAYEVVDMALSQETRTEATRAEVGS
jgi:hypothetical protein